MGSFVVRHYQPRDRSRVRQIAWDTAYRGAPASAFFESEEFLKDLLTGYFTDYEPESCFVAESDNTIVGYLLGCRHSARLDRVSMRRIAPRLIGQLACRDVLLRAKNLRFGLHMLNSLICGEFSVPDLTRAYPATMHINLAQGFRRMGAGTRLMSSFLTYLKEFRIPGVRLATYSPEAGSFFERSGFTLVFQKKRTYFRYITGSDISVYIYAKELLKTGSKTSKT